MRMPPDLKMPSAALVTVAARRFPGLRRLPLLEIVLVGQVVMLAREHLERLTPRERHRIVVLLRDCRGRVGHLPEDQRAELQALIAKVEPRLFAETATRTLSPLPLLGRVTRRW